MYQRFKAKLLAPLLFLGMLPASVYAQTTPLEKRRVLGVVSNQHDVRMSGATISLFSPLDTLHTSTNPNGIFAFDDVRSAEFLLTVKMLGYDTYNRKYFNNDTQELLRIPTIRLGVKVEELEEVMITGMRGSVVRGDTTEFWARDYIVRDFARLRDLLQRMEGITIDAEGSVFHNGQEVTRALFNNETYFSGSVKEAISELPADIVDRIQIIDRSADGETARKLQSEETTKVMNIVTKEDKTRGTMIDLVAEGGTQSRGRVDGNYKQIDGPHQRQVAAGYREFPEGLQEDDVPGSVGANAWGAAYQLNPIMDGSGPLVSGGRLKEAIATLNQQFVWDSFRVSPLYRFNHLDRSTTTRVYSEHFYEEGHLSGLTDQDRHRREQTHRLSADFRGTWQKGQKGSYSGFANLNYLTYDQSGRELRDRTGIINSLEREDGALDGRSLRGGGRISFERSLGADWGMRGYVQNNFDNAEEDEELRTDVFALRDQTLAPDSSLHQLRHVLRNTTNMILQAQLTWAASDRLSTQFTIQPQHSYSLRDLQTRIREGGSFVDASALSDYQRTHHWQVPVTITPEYRFGGGAYIAPSFAVENAWTAGQLKPGTPDIARFDILWNPQLTIGYRNPDVGNMSIRAVQTSTQPAVADLNPDPVYLTPFYIHVGDPDLRNNLSRELALQYSHLYRRAALNVSMNTRFSRTLRTTGTDQYLEIDPVSGIITTTHRRVNVSGGNSQFYRLGLTKIFAKSRSTLKYTGVVNLREIPYQSRGSREIMESTALTNDLSYLRQISNWMDVTTEVQYRARENRNSLALAADGKTFHRTFLAELKLSFFLPGDIRINTDLSQSLYETTNIMSNTAPFVVNANIERRFLSDESMILSLVVMDAARQNAYTAYMDNQFGYTNRVTNTDSRYYLLQLSWKPQYWGRSRRDTGQGRNRDGSFVR